jgi:hypothetical protein
MSHVITTDSTTTVTPTGQVPASGAASHPDIDLRDDELAAVRGVFCGVMLSLPLWISAAAVARWAFHHAR